MCGFPSCSCRLCNWHKQHEQPMKTKPRWGHSYSCHLRGKGKVREMAHDVREAHLHVVVSNVYCNLMYWLTRVFAIIRPFVFFYIYIYIHPYDFCDRHALQLGRSMVLTECLCTPMHKIALLGRCKRCRRSCNVAAPSAISSQIDC